MPDKAVAIKVYKNHSEIVRNRQEKKLPPCLDPDTCNIVRWNGFFFDKDHIYLNFELLDQSLHMKDRNNQGPIKYQLATALSHLKSMGIAHADLRLDNIMVVDCNNSLWCAVQPGVCVHTTWYRAPEVPLRFAFNEAIDMWSMGLVAAELAAGYPLYPGDMDYDVLSFNVETEGPDS